MTGTIIITFCALLLLAYFFDITSSKTRIPSVILLLALGWGVKQLVNYLEIPVADFSSVLPVLGTVGLLLIVLEGSLELELNKSKFKLVGKSFIGALLPIIALSFILAFLFKYWGNHSLKDGFINAIPFCVISSAIAIPSVRNLSKPHKEFIIYESSLSDIIGVLLFNFITVNETITMFAFANFGLQMIIILLVSVLATIALSYLLNKIQHHIKFIPIILLIILIYEGLKMYNLPSLLFILIFGLFIGNLNTLKQYKWLQRFKPDQLQAEVKKFKKLAIEGTFMVRALFFLLFGFLIKTAEIINVETLPMAFIIVALIIIFRIIQLKLIRMPLNPLLFIAPRGLITILLFLSISVTHKLSYINKSLLIQVIILTALFMMFGLMFGKKHKEEEQLSLQKETESDEED